MLVIADYINPLERNRLLRAQKFLNESGKLSYCIVPQDDRDCDDGLPVVAEYKDEPFFDWDYFTNLQLNTSENQIHLETDLTDATILICFLADQPSALDWISRMVDHNNDEAVVRSFNIDPTSACRPSVKGWAPGEFLAPSDGRYVFFSVSTHGEVSVISQSTDLSAVAFHYAAHQEIDRTKLVARLGKIPV